MQQNIDQRFREEIGKLDGSPLDLPRDPQASWDTIASMLDQEKRKRRGAWIWISAAASVALLIGLGWILIPREPETTDSFSQIMNSLDTSAQRVIAQNYPPPPPNEELLEFENSQDLQHRIDVLSGTEDPNFRAGKPKPRFDKNDQVVSLQLTANGASTVVSTQNISANATYHWSPRAATNVGVVPNPSPTTNYSVGKAAYYSNQGAKSLGWAGNNRIPASGTYKVVVTDANGCQNKSKLKQNAQQHSAGYFGMADSSVVVFQDQYGSESYAETVENQYFQAIREPLSTFSIDVDRASYTNHRRFIESGQLPPKYSVRAEEFINYFDYSYAQPHGGDPFSILPEVTTCPWNPKHKLARIAIKGREVSMDRVPPSNIVFLLDVSGSMEDANKLPLLKTALGMLTEKLREQDKVSIVVYAGAAGLVLPPTSGINKRAIMTALENLTAGGSTAGGEGIELAYATAKQNFMKEGNNRVILATDGDFNVGTSDETGLERLIVKKREEGVFLSVLGFGEGNLQDSKMELLADKGNGNYNYIDGEKEAHKVLVSEFGGTLYTIAKDVKIQVEFNPAKVQSYRLIGYENRKLQNEDFANDKIDAGELGAGHTVTALYEIVPTQDAMAAGSSDLRYQTRVLSDIASGKELLTVKLRYKDPNGSVSKLLEQPLIDDGRTIAQTSEDFRWAVAVAEYALILRQSEYKGLASYEQVLTLAKSAMSRDKEGLRKEFVQLVTKAASFSQSARRN